MNELIEYLSYNDNEIGKIYRDGFEYIIEINLWNGDICRLKTVNCKRIVHNLELVDEFGDIKFFNGTYQFMTFDDEEVILEINADNIIIQRMTKN